MFTSKRSATGNVGVRCGLILAGSIALWSTSTFGQDAPLRVTLGQPVSSADAAAADWSVTPDGANLPAGSGTPEQGKAVYEAQCASCHGPEGQGGEGLVEPLVGGIDTLASAAPMKTVGSYWPYASTLFDYTRRAMPLNAPLSLTDDEVYAVSAYLLSLDGIIEAAAVMNAESLAAVEMPNRAGFVSQWPGHTH